MKPQPPPFVVSYRTAANWARLRDRLAFRCVDALNAGDVQLAKVLARRHKSADERAAAAQKRAWRQEIEAAANRKGLH